MRHLCQHLNMLDEVSTELRIAVELLIDTGRCPNEICQLDWDCLDRDADGKPVLVYDNHKNNRPQPRQPIPEATAALISTHRQRVRERFPDTPTSELKLLPAPKSNPVGSKGVGKGWISG
jgi:integrase